ncbi:MAG TPA: ABC transporter permease [Abditibacteriaceae bacterium]|jgi:putative ABC transport system permease protein
MTWILLSLREWQRRPLRMSITTAGVALAVAALWSLLAFAHGYKAGLRNDLDKLGAHIIVVPKGCPYDAASLALHGASWPCYLKAEYLKQVRAVQGIAVAAPVLMNAYFDGSGAQTVYVGVEGNMLRLKRNWHVNGHFPSRAGEILIGADVAQRHMWRVGQAVRLPGTDNKRGVVSGILAPTQSADDTFIHLRLADAQRLFGHRNELTHILVQLQDPNRMEHAVAELRGCGAGFDMNVVPMAHLFTTIGNVVNSTRALLAGIAFVAFLVAGAGVSNSVMMAVAERTREIGVMRALGASHSDIFRLFWSQTMQVCLLGAAGGVMFALLGARVVEAWLRTRLPFAPSGSLVQPEAATTVICFACALFIGSVAGLLPAWRAARLAPTVAMNAQGGRA